MTKPIGTIEQSGGVAYALWTEDGPAIFPSMELLIESSEAGDVTPAEGDAEYYEEQGERSPWFVVQD